MGVLSERASSISRKTCCERPSNWILSFQQGGAIVLKGSLEVIEFDPRQVMKDAVPRYNPPQSDDLLSHLRLQHRTLTNYAVALAVLALHVLLIAPAFLGGGPFRHIKEIAYRGSPALQWVVLEDSSGRPAAIGSPSRPRFRAIRVTDVLPPLPTLPAEDSGAQEQSGLGAIRGRYLGQIHARVDRAWLRPRTAIGAPIFQCEVQIDQDGVGRVLEITLLACNGGSRWQLSLVHAIESASPLPASPDPAVFAHRIVLHFRALTYAPGQPADSYEPVRRDLNTDEQTSSALAQLRSLRNPSRLPGGTGAIELRIQGSRVEVKQQR